jgi:hypothetical protein
VNRAAAEGGFSKDNAHLSRIPMVLDADGWKEIAGELNSLLDRVERIQRASSKRLLKQNHQGELRGELVMMLFETLEAEVPPKGRKQQRRASGKSKARA